MKILKNLFVLLLIVTQSAQAQKETPPAGGTPKDFVLPAKQSMSLDNGMTTTMVQYGAIPKVNIRLVIKTGNIHETADQVWLADLTADLLREGTASMDFATIAKKAAAMGGDINVSVGADQTFISGSVLSDFAPDLIAIMGDMVMNPAFPESEIDRLKNDLKRSLAVQQTRPQAQASSEFFKIIYPDHPYGRFYPTEEMVDSFTIDMVKDFYSSNFGAKRSVLYVVGKFDQEKVKTAVETSFATWQEGPEVYYPAVTAQQTDQIALFDRQGAPQTTIRLGLPTLTPDDPDYIALSITNSLLGGSFASRITSNIREDKGYTYSPSSSVRTRKGTSVWSENADVTTEHTSAALKEIAKEIRLLQEEPPSQEELEGIQNYAAGVFVLQNSTPGGIIGQLNFMDLHELDDTYLTERVKNIFAVTPEKVSEITKEYIKYENMTLVMVGDKAVIQNQMQEAEYKERMR